MGPFLSMLFGGGIQSINSLYSTIFGNRAARESGVHDENMASRQEFATEFTISNRGFLDRGIDFFNRLPRPLLVSMLIYYFLLAINDPLEFQIVNTSLEGIPERMWDLAFVIFGFYFIVREFDKSRSSKLSLNEAEFNVQMSKINKLKHMQKLEELRGTAKTEFKDVKIGMN